jgi:hypothetical protein
VLLVGVVFCVSCPEWRGMPHNQQNDLVLLIFIFPVSTLQRIKSLPESLERTLFAKASSSKLPTIETLCSFSTSRCTSLSLSHFDCHYLQEKGIPFDPNSYVKVLRNGFKMEVQTPYSDLSGNYRAKLQIKSAVFVFIVLCSYPTVVGYGNFGGGGGGGFNKQFFLLDLKF